MAKRKGVSQFSHEDYTVGWVCAITTEYIAAQEFLDEEHEPLESLPNDTNDYALGRIGKHNVVIAVLPEGQYGLANAASVANNMVRSFAHIRIGLMVGIGGGVPSERHDVRLGDVVVSTVTGSHGAVFQYDYGKTIQGQDFQVTSFINQPPALLQTAVSGLRTQYERKGSRLHESVEEVLNKNRRLRNKFQQPDLVTDRLYLSTVIHDGACCADTHDPSKVVDRPPRIEREDDPMVHYGLIASANQVMRDAIIRDNLSRKLDVLCFEMEAAGLMNHFPCLIIRGICDYSDTHKNNKWQGYAAMTAAAYTWDLLHRIQPSKVNIEKRLSEFVYNTNKRLEDIQSSTYNTERLVERIKTDNRLECLRQWLDPPDPSVNFNKAIELRQAGSGQWLLQDSRYLSCKNRGNSLLWLHGIPGCGKTVLSTTIIQDLEKGEIVLYFYFDFNDTRKQTFQSMIRSLCYQLYHNEASQPHLDLLYSDNKDGEKQPSTESLESTFRMMVQETGKICILLDALDECSTLENHHTGGLLSWIDSFRSSQSNAHFVATSRPEHAIQSHMDVWPDVMRLPLGSHLTKDDINSYIVARVKQLSRWQSRTDIQDEIISALNLKADGMYRWVSCQFDILRDCRDPRILRTALESLPRTLDQTYSRILASVPLDHRHYTIRLLQFLTFSERPLRIEEAVDAIAVNTDHKPYFNPEDRMPVPEEVLSYCSSLVAMTNRRGPNSRYELEDFKELSLAHFSVKEYLISDRFQQDDQMKDVRFDFLETNARASIVKVCVAYLLGLEALISTSPGADTDEYYYRLMPPTDEKIAFQQKYPMAQYSAEYWPEQARLAKDIGEGKSLIWDLMKSTAYKINLSAHDNSSIFSVVWSGLHFPPKLYYASLVGLSWLVEGLLEDGADINTKGDIGTVLNVAVARGHDEIVHLLLQAGADPDARNMNGETPLYFAAERGADRIVQWLVEYTTDINAISRFGPPLRVAAKKGHGEIVRCLLKHGADVSAADGSSNYMMTVLQEAVRGGHVEIIRQLLEHGADINEVRLYGTALRWAVRRGHCMIVQLLINQGADLDLAGSRGGTPLQAAVHQSHGNIVQCLLDHGADADLVSEDQIASDQGFVKIGRHLLKHRESADNFNNRNTPLYLAASRGLGKIVQQLLEHGADVNAISTSEDSDETALEGALAGGHIEIAQQLIKHGANVNARSKRHGSALYQAVTKGLGQIVEQLLDLGADPNVAGDRGTALHEAVKGGHEGLIQQLIDHGADIDSYSEAFEGTPLSAAVHYDRCEIVRLLLQNGANVNTTGNDFDVPALTMAAAKGNSEIVRQLLEYNADTDALSWVGGTALQAAAGCGHSEIVQMLLDRGADASIAAGHFGTALRSATICGHDDIVKQLCEHEADLAPTS